MAGSRRMRSWSARRKRDKAILGDLQNAVGFRRLRPRRAEGTVGDQVNWLRGDSDFAGGQVALRDCLHRRQQVARSRGNSCRLFSGAVQPRAADQQQLLPVHRAVRRPTHSTQTEIAGASRSTITPRRSAPRSPPAPFALAPTTPATTSATATTWPTPHSSALFTALPWFEEGESALSPAARRRAFSQQFPKNNIVTFDQARPIQPPLQPATDDPLTPFVPNITINASQLPAQYNLEAALVLGPLSFQAEWTAANVDQIEAGGFSLPASAVTLSSATSSPANIVSTIPSMATSPAHQVPLAVHLHARPILPCAGSGSLGSWLLASPTSISPVRICRPTPRQA